jgi:DNA-binding NarL/FixJ family response regulator
MIKVFIIDDHPAIHIAIEYMLSAPEDRALWVGSSLNIRDALVKIPSLVVDVILMDLYINEKSPVENMQFLRNACPETPIIIYSAETSIWWKSVMFEHGANAFIDKCSNNEKIISTILQVSDGSVLLPPAVKDLLRPDLHALENRLFTREELEVGKELSFGFSIKEIAEKQEKSPSSIEKHLRNMRMKTHTRSNPDLTRELIARKLIPAA